MVGELLADNVYLFSSSTTSTRTLVKTTRADKRWREVSLIDISSINVPPQGLPAWMRSLSCFNALVRFLVSRFFFLDTLSISSPSLRHGFSVLFYFPSYFEDFEKKHLHLLVTSALRLPALIPIKLTLSSVEKLLHYLSLEYLTSGTNSSSRSTALI